MKTLKNILSNIYTSKPKTKFINKKGFTLVELIIVITILAILGTVAFSSYRGITESARDSNRLATLKELEKGLDLYKAQTGNYPMPEGQIHTGVLSLSGEIDYSYMGIVGENVSSQLKLNSVPLDPLSNANYVYATNKNRTRYQIATVFERLEAYKKPGQNMKSPGQNMKFNIFDKQELCLIQETYANDSSYKAKVLGNHKTEVKIENGGKIWLTTVPSMIFDSSSIQGTTLSGYILNSSGSYLIVNKGKNLPYKLNSNDTTANQKGDEIMQLIRENTKAKIVSIDITEIVNGEKSIEQVFGTGGENEILPGIKSKEILSSFGVKEEDLANTSAITSKMEIVISGGTTSNYTPPTNNNCSLSGQTINHGSSITAYKSETIDKFDNINTCENNSQVKICNNGTLSGDANYIYTNCVKGVVNNCSASGSYVYNSHTYSIPEIDHTNTGTILSNTVNENHGQFKYTLTNIKCNDGNYEDITENLIPTLQSCDENYGINGNICSASQNGICDNTVALGCSTGTAISDNGQTACGTTRTWNCAGLYGGSNSVQCSKANAVCTVSGSCTGKITNAVYYGDVTSYSLVNAPNGTSLTGSYLANPTENTCEWKCASGYGYSGGFCYASQNGVCDNTVALGCSTGTAINDNGQTSCGTTRTWNCSGLYGGTTSSQCSLANASCYTYSWSYGSWGSCSVSSPTLGSWGSCSVSCGGGTQSRTCTPTNGTQSRTVTCLRNDGITVDNSYCGSPITSQSCTASCSGYETSQSCNGQPCEPMCTVTLWFGNCVELGMGGGGSWQTYSSTCSFIDTLRNYYPCTTGPGLPAYRHTW